jgi:hypothetical protein
MAQLSKSRWLLVPVWFAGLLFIALLIRWWPLAAARAHDAYGVGTVVIGDTFLAWKSIIRGVVALTLTLIAWSYLPPLKKHEIVIIAACAVVAEVAAEIATGALIGPRASLWYQLLATCVAYATVGAVSVLLLSRSANARMAL